MRLFGRRRRQEPEPLVDDGTLVVLGRAMSAERGDAAVLDDITSAGHDLACPLLVRHLFTARSAAAAASLGRALAEEGFDVRRPEADEAASSPDGTLVVVASATAVLTPMSAAQARARMTGLTTRLDVDYAGWEALAPP